MNMNNSFIYEPRFLPWQKDEGEDIELAKREILSILREQKVSLAKTRHLFYSILREIEEDNPISL